METPFISNGFATEKTVFEPDFLLCPAGGFISGRKVFAMLKPSLTYAGTIKDIQDRDDLILVTDSQEVQSVLEHINYPPEDDENALDFSGLFVSIQDGDFVEIYAYLGSIPYLFENIWKINHQ